MAASLYSISVTHPTTCSNGTITINGPSTEKVSYILNGTAESTPTSVLPIVISSLSPGTHTLQLNTGTSAVNFLAPIVLSSAYVLSISSMWFWFWVFVLFTIVFLVVGVIWSRRNASSQD